MIELFTQWSTLIGLLLTAGSIAFGVHIFRRQMNAQLFLEYTKRYDEIMGSFPADARSVRLDLCASPPEPSPATTLATLKYMNLCSEEFYLWKRGYLAKDIWGIWQQELNRFLRCELFKREWAELGKEFDSYSEFRAYVDKVQRGNSQV